MLPICAQWLFGKWKSIFNQRHGSTDCGVSKLKPNENLLFKGYTIADSIGDSGASAASSGGKWELT